MPAGWIYEARLRFNELPALAHVGQDGKTNGPRCHVREGRRFYEEAIGPRRGTRQDTLDLAYLRAHQLRILG